MLFTPTEGLACGWLSVICDTGGLVVEDVVIAVEEVVGGFGPGQLPRAMHGDSLWKLPRSVWLMKRRWPDQGFHANVNPHGREDVPLVKLRLFGNTDSLREMQNTEGHKEQRQHRESGSNS